MKILHITESLAAGVGQVIELAAQAQAANNHHVVLAHSVREDTPSPNELAEKFSGIAARVVIPMVTQISPYQDLKCVIRLMTLIQTEQPDVIHLHSSKAGVLGRIAARLVRSPARVFYSPHGFAFLRRDVSALKQGLFLSFERIAAKLGGTLVACSATEYELGVTRVGHPSVRLIENAVNLEDIPVCHGLTNEPVMVITAGRVCYQKAPWRFTQLAAQSQDLAAQFVWLGSGPLDQATTTSAPQNFTLTGWLSRQAVNQYLEQAGVFVMTSLWEGMPLALIEAQAAGIPAVVPRVIGCQDVVIDGETGFICDNDTQLQQRLEELILNPSLRAKMGENAATMAKKRFTLQRFTDEWLQLYAGNT